VFLLGIAVVYYAYHRGRKSVLGGSTRTCGETNDDKNETMIDKGQSNAEESTAKKYPEREVLGGALRYFDGERVGTAMD